jgi:hypothetical protein
MIGGILLRIKKLVDALIKATTAADFAGSRIMVRSAGDDIIVLKKNILVKT